MNRLALVLRDISNHLSKADLSWALIGGLAVSARIEPRFTADIDLVVAVGNDAEAETLVRRLIGAGYGVSATVEQDATSRLATVRLTSPVENTTGVMVDLLFASSGIEPEIAASAETIEIFDGIEIPLATTGHLLALKLLSRDDKKRPQDAIDICALINAAGNDELARTREALRLIRERGYHRDRDLDEALIAALRLRLQR